MTSLLTLGLLWLATSVCAFHPPSSLDSFELDSKYFSDDEHSSPPPAVSTGRTTWTATGNHPIEVKGSPTKEMKIFCWPGLPRTVRRLWYTAHFILNMPEDSFHLYRGATEKEVQDQFQSSSRFFALIPWRDRIIKLNGFSATCIGIYTNEPYTLTLKIRHIDIFQLGMFITGAILVLCARKLSRNTVFHYGSGISIALIGSLLVIIFYASRMIPRKTFGVTFMVGGWAVILYVFQTMWKNFRETISKHRHYVAVYVAAVSAISFLLIYRFGGVRNPRTMDILQWGMQFVGAVLIYCSCSIEILGLALVVLTVALDMFFHSGYSGYAFRRIPLVNWLFPPRPRKLLSQEEYETVGRLETVKALEDLRNYCNSPQCKSWSLVKKLNTPQRMSLFVDEGTHLLQDEVDSYEQEVSFDNFDEDGDEEDDQRRHHGSPAVAQVPRSSNGRTFADRFGGRGLLYRNSNSSPNSNGVVNRSRDSVNRYVEPMDYE